MTDNPFGGARDDVYADALLRTADPVPGAELEHHAVRLADDVGAFLTARQNLRPALNPDIDPDGTGGRDAALVAQRQEEYVTARSMLAEGAQRMLDALDADREEGGQ